MVPDLIVRVHEFDLGCLAEDPEMYLQIRAKNLAKSVVIAIGGEFVLDPDCIFVSISRLL